MNKHIEEYVDAVREIRAFERANADEPTSDKRRLALDRARLRLNKVRNRMQAGEIMQADLRCAATGLGRIRA